MTEVDTPFKYDLRCYTDIDIIMMHNIVRTHTHTHYIFIYLLLEKEDNTVLVSVFVYELCHDINTYAH